MAFFLICGPQSAGNRFLAALLHRAGVLGEPSRKQSKTCPNHDGHFWIQHEVSHETMYKIEDWNPVLLITARETHALIKSAVKQRHFDNEDEALRHSMLCYANAIQMAVFHDVPFEIISYEQWQDPGAIYHFLRRHGLRTDNLDEPLHLPDQRTGQRFVSQNWKHYEQDPIRR